MAKSVEKHPTTTNRMGTTVKPLKGDALGDAGSRELRGLMAKTGNQGLDGKMKEQGAMRDALLAFIAQRLKTMHTVQHYEKEEMKHEREWFRPLARGASGYHLPDPTRWHDAARLFQQSAQAMCNGNLAQGAALMERAMEAERAAYESTPAMVEEHLDHTNNQAAPPPAELAHVGSRSTCPTRAMPKEIAIADRILAIGDTMERPPPLNRRRGNAWWREEEEEEEEDEDKKGDKKGDKK